MTKKYAIIQPAWTWDGDGIADLPYPVVTLFHKIKYERVCGYSLGRKIAFYDDFISAKKTIEDNLQNAIIELDFEDNRIINFRKIYEVKGMEEKIKKCEDSEYFETVLLPWFEERVILPSDISRGALNEINSQYHNLKETLKDRIPQRAP